MNRDGYPGDRREDDLDRASEVFDGAWEAGARATLERAGFDGELAVYAARDALRVLSGDLTEDEFHERYHEAYVREFGRDDRPRLADGHEPEAESICDTSESLAPADGKHAGESFDSRGVRPELFSRRRALQLAGAGTAALYLGQMLGGQARGAAADGDAVDDQAPARGDDGGEAVDARRVRWGMVVDLDLCNGCLFCVAGCKAHNGLPDGVHWMYVLAYGEPDRPGDVNQLVRPCQHCSNAPCVKVCPVAARHRREDGLVLTDYDICIGCRYCEVACPYGVNYFQWAESASYGGGFEGERRDARGRSVVGDPPKGVMGKCTFCPERQDSPELRGTTVCELACPHGVMHFGDLNDPNSKPNRYLEEKRRENGGKLHTFRLLEDLGTGPNVIYIGSPPSRRTEPVEPPVAYEDRGFVEERRTVLEGPEPWFLRVVRRD